MFRKKTKEPTPLDEAYDALLAKLAEMSPETKEYAKTLKRVSELTALKEQAAPKRVSKETLLIVAGNLAGIALILGYEQANVVTSKAVGFAGKLR